MADEPSGYELGRTIDAMRVDISGRFDNLDRRLDSFVSAQVHASDLRRLDQRIDALDADIAELKSAKRWAIGIAVTAAGVIVAIVAVIGDLL